MAVHDEFAALATELIAENGRAMTLRKLSRTPADANKPWRGPLTTAAGFEFELPVIGVVTDYDEDEIDGEQVRRGDKKLLVSAQSITQDLLKADQLLDEGIVMNIIKGNLLKPGTTAILYTFQVRS